MRWMLAGLLISLTALLVAVGGMVRHVLQHHGRSKGNAPSTADESEAKAESVEPES